MQVDWGPYTVHTNPSGQAPESTEKNPSLDGFWIHGTASPSSRWVHTGSRESGEDAAAAARASLAQLASIAPLATGGGGRGSQPRNRSARARGG